MRLTLIGVLALAAGMGIGRFAFTPLLPVMQRESPLTLELAGWLAAANYLGYLLGALAALWLRLPAVTTLRAALLATAVLTAAMGLTDDAGAWLWLRTGAGVASAWVLIFASSLVLGALAGRGRTGAGTVLFSGVGLGTALTGLLCVLFVELAWPAARAWIALGVAALLLALPIVARARDLEVAIPATPAAGDARARRLGVRGCWLPILCYGCFGFGYIVPATFLPAMAREAVADPAVFAWAWPVFGAAAFVATVLTGPLARRVPHRELWSTSQLLLAAGVALPVLWPGITAVGISSLIVGGAFMVVTAAAMQEARRLAAGADLAAAMTAAFAGGQLLGPVLVSVLAAGRTGLDLTLLVAAVVLAASAIALRRWRGRTTRHGGETTSWACRPR